MCVMKDNEPSHLYGFGHGVAKHQPLMCLRCAQISSEASPRLQTRQSECDSFPPTNSSSQEVFVVLVSNTHFRRLAAELLIS